MQDTGNCLELSLKNEKPVDPLRHKMKLNLSDNNKHVFKNKHD